MKKEQLRGKILYFILVFAFILRVLWSFFVPVGPVADSAAYEILARSVATGSGYAWQDGSITSYWPPGTAFIYAVFFRLFPNTYLPIVIFQILIGVGLVYLGYRCALLFFTKNIALITALFLAFWPLLIQFTTILASELLFLIPIISATLLVYKKGKPVIRHWIFFGLLIGIATYIRPTGLPLIIILPLLAALRYHQYKKMLGFILVGGLICMMLIAPWSWRNTRLYGEFTTISTNFGTNLWMGNNNNSKGTYQALKYDQKFENEKEREVYFKQEAITFISNNPVKFLQMGIKRTKATFDRETIGVVWNEKGLVHSAGCSLRCIKFLKIISSAYWYLMLLLALVGFIFLLYNEQWKILTNPIFMLSGYFAAIPIIVVGQDRYHFAMIPLIAILAAYSVFQINKVRLKLTNNK